MSFEEKYLRFIHWDFQPENIGEINKDKSQVELAMSPILQNDTNKPTGFGFNWKCRLYSNAGQFLGCIAQDEFRIYDTRILFPENNNYFHTNFL